MTVPEPSTAAVVLLAACLFASRSSRRTRR
jgi:hypothetical protein